MKWILLILTLIITRNSIEPEPEWNFDEQLNSYFLSRVQQIEESHRAKSTFTKENYQALQEEARQQLLDMLGLHPLPDKTDLNVRITSEKEYEYFVVENIVFESMPGLYVTGNIYRPKVVKEPLPAILYVCGHATVEKDGYNYGAKANYQHHPAWYARNGYICLILDTVQLGEIEGIHHGLYRYDRWWWLSKGYTPAGVEAWNGIRALDYLESRPDVDVSNIGMTGRSGGGATSWWVGALDKRVKAIAPIAGITDLRNHVVDGCVERHCDCMYFANSYQWDYPMLGLLMAPRPLLIANSDKDAMFPLDGVYRTYEKMKSYYDLLGASDLIALNIVGGGHQDIQDIQIPTFRWFNRFLKNDNPLIGLAATKYLPPEALRVLSDIPGDERNTSIDQHFVNPAISILQDTSHKDYNRWKQKISEDLKANVFMAWPPNSEYQLGKINEFESTEVQLDLYNLRSQEYIDLPLMILRHGEKQSATGIIKILDDEEWKKLQPFLSRTFGKNDIWQNSLPGMAEDSSLEVELKDAGMIVYLPMRGAGISAYSADIRQQVHIKRSYYLLGETLQSAQTFDLGQGLKAIKDLFPNIKSVYASGQTGVMLIYAALDQSGYELWLNSPSRTHKEGPFYLNVLRYVDIPDVLLMTSLTNTIHLEEEGHDYEELIKYIGDKKDFKILF